MNKNILVTGSKGQLGSEIKELAISFPNYCFFYTDVEELDITKKRDIEVYLHKNKIHIIINCAAYTVVDKAESEPILADAINHLAVKTLAELAKEHNLKLIHISTDYVFNGEGFKPYTENHATSPVNTYGKTKLDGEKALQKVNPSGAVIIRTSWVYSFYGNNFVKTMLRLGDEKEELNVISDQVGAPTYAYDLAKFIVEHLLETEKKDLKIYHYTNEGVCSWYDFALEIMHYANKRCSIKPISTSAYPTPAKRPFYSLMDKIKVKEQFNLQIPHWKISLQKCIDKIK